MPLDKGTRSPLVAANRSYAIDPKFHRTTITAYRRSVGTRYSAPNDGELHGARQLGGRAVRGAARTVEPQESGRLSVADRRDADGMSALHHAAGFA